MKALFGEMKVPGVIGLVLAATLGYSWARGVEDAAAIKYWPASDPALMKRVLEATDPDETAMSDVGPAIDPRLIGSAAK